MPPGVTTIAHADDLAIVIVAETEAALMNRGNKALQYVGKCLSENKLKLAPE